MGNLILTTDSYKISHYKQYPPGTQKVFSFFESRGGEFEEIVFFGLQYILLKHFFEPISKWDIQEAHEICLKHFPEDKDIFNYHGWQYILDNYDGYLPLEIKAVQEGSVVPPGNVLMTVVNTDPKVPWLTNYVETILSQVWYPCTVATQSRKMKKLILNYLECTGDPSGIDFKLHDFGYRGSTSDESAAIGSASHLINFKGTDTFAGIQLLRDYYDELDMPGFSIPAAEHSTITSWGKENEAKAYQNMLEQYPTGLVAVVSDSYDIYNACENLWGKELKDQVLARDGVLIVRPDSGTPAPTVLKVIEILGKQFGFEENALGFKVLNPKIRVIQGDGIDYNEIHNILLTLTSNYWSADNIAFGSGGGLLQKVNRDTCKFAFKASAIQINNEWHDVYKDPITDPGKSSKKGRLKLTKINDQYKTVKYEDNLTVENQLQTVFKNGKILVYHTFEDIRDRAKWQYKYIMSETNLNKNRISL